MKHLFAALVIVAAGRPDSGRPAEGQLAARPDGQRDHRLPAVRSQGRKEGRQARGRRSPTAGQVPRSSWTAFEAKGDRVHGVGRTSVGTKRTFEGVVDDKDAKIVRGTFGDEHAGEPGRAGRPGRARSDPTPAELAGRKAQRPEPFAQAQVYRTPRPVPVPGPAVEGRQRQGRPAGKGQGGPEGGRRQGARPVRETVDKHGDTPQAVDAATQLVPHGGEDQGQPAGRGEVDQANRRGRGQVRPALRPRHPRANAEILRTQKGMEALALATARAGPTRPRTLIRRHSRSGCSAS